MVRLMAIFALLFNYVSLRAETVAMTSAQARCTRANLQKTVDSYVDALKKGTASLMPLASHAKYIENRKEIPFGQGIWQTPLAVDFHRSLLDVDTCQTFTEIISAKSIHPYVIGTRLKIADNKISEVEALITDKDDWLFNADNYLKYSSREKWDILPAAQRTDRQTLINVANAFFDIFSYRSAASKVPWGIPCGRLEGGMYNDPNGDPKVSCTGGAPLEGTLKITNRRYLVDVDMGTVVGLVDFGAENGWPDAHTFRLENGKVRYVHTLTVCPNGCGLPSSKEKAKSQ
jgi:hypothetical protein